MARNKMVAIDRLFDSDRDNAVVRIYIAENSLFRVFTSVHGRVNAGMGT